MMFGKSKTRKVFGLRKPYRTYTILSNEGKQLAMENEKRKKKGLIKLTRKKRQRKSTHDYLWCLVKEKWESSLFLQNYVGHTTSSNERKQFVMEKEKNV